MTKQEIFSRLKIIYPNLDTIFYDCKHYQVCLKMKDGTEIREHEVGCFRRYIW